MENIEAEAIKLPPDERVILAYRILDTVSGDFASPEIEQDWMEEIERRLDALDRGEMEAIPAEEVFAEARARIKR